MEITPQESAPADRVAASVHVLWAVEAACDGDRAAAIDLFAQALDRDARCVDAWLWLAELLPDRQAAVRFLETALAIDPASGHRRPRLGQ